jgi:radical SAM superfamily enzyme YgiQ (UPF0313 family)
VDNVLREIEECLGWYSEAEFVNFIDDTLCLNRKWMEEFCDKFPKRFKLPFHGNTRANLLDKDMLALLKKGGCERLDVGIEAGSSYIRNEILRRNISDEQIRRAFELAPEFDIKLSAYNMIGCPFETPEQVLETIKLNASLKPYASHNAIFQPYPNTYAYELCRDNNFIAGKEVSAFFKESLLDQPRLNRGQVVFFSRYFPILMKFYGWLNKLPKKASLPLASVLDKAAIYFSKSRIALRLSFLFFAVFSPIKTIKMLVMGINPSLARELKHIIYGRYYMKGKS